jgi:hypothetical protein
MLAEFQGGNVCAGTLENRNFLLFFLHKFALNYLGLSLVSFVSFKGFKVNVFHFNLIYLEGSISR